MLSFASFVWSRVETKANGLSQPFFDIDQRGTWFESLSTTVSHTICKAAFIDFMEVTE